MKRGNNWYYRFMLIGLVLILVLPVLAGCGDDNDETTQPATTQPATTQPATTQPATTQPATTQPATTQPATTQPVSTAPIKVGLLSDWIGPTASGGPLHEKGVAVFMDELKAQQGGLVLGREFKIVTADGEGSVSGGASAAKKLIIQEKVSMIIGGGGSSAENLSVGAVCNQYKVPYVQWGAEPLDLSDKPYQINAFNISNQLIFRTAGEFAVNKLGAKKVAVLGENSDVGRSNVAVLKAVMESGNVDVGNVDYINVGTVDFSPYLTRAKATKPDVIFMYAASSAAYMTVFKQMAELGMTDIKFVALCLASSYSVSLPQAVGSYHALVWVPPRTNPANLRFVTDYKAKFGESIPSTTALGYHVCWTAVKAIELAGSSDRDAIQKAMRSGNLAFDSILGADFRIGTDGLNNVKPTIAIVEPDHTFKAVYP